MADVVHTGQANEASSCSTVPGRTVEQAPAEKLVGSLSIRTLASVFGVSPSTVHRDVTQARLRAATRDREGRLVIPMVEGADGKLRPSLRYDTSDRDRVIRSLRAAGLTVRAIASEVGCSVGTVHRVVKAED